jgi:ABC-type dipeptide/oligopeptide/nickel transport system permease subunit
MRWLRSQSVWFTVAGTLVLLGLGVALVAGLQIPERYVTSTYELGRAPEGRTYQVPPFTPDSNLLLFASGGGRESGVHYYLLGSDAGGRDLLGLLARGALPSLELVAAALVGRFVVGIVAGVAMGLGAGFVSVLSRSMGRWFAGFPYLAFAIIVIQTLSAHNRFAAFAVAMAAVGWRDVAELTAEQVEHVRSQSYAEAAKALGTDGVRFFSRHVMPHLRPVLFTEMAFQASSVLVLLAELGYLQVYVGAHFTALYAQSGGGRGPLTVAYRLAPPEIGGMLADARNYILLEQWVPVLVPAVAVGLLALAFELYGWALRTRSPYRRLAMPEDVRAGAPPRSPRVPELAVPGR